MLQTPEVATVRTLSSRLGQLEGQIATRWRRQETFLETVARVLCPRAEAVLRRWEEEAQAARAHLEVGAGGGDHADTSDSN